MRRTGVLTIVLTCALLAALPAIASARVQLKSFQSPTKNISCVMVLEGVRCDIQHRDWSPPPKPRSCDLDYGQGLSVGKHGRSGFVCAGDTTIDPTAQILSYGQSISLGGFRCTSAATGMTCTHPATGHGFFISIQSYRIF